MSLISIIQIPQSPHMDIIEEKKSSHTLRATALHKTHPWVHCTPFMIYITIRNQRSPLVKNVSWVWKSSSLFPLPGMGIDGERVNGNDSFKRFLMSLLTSWVLVMRGTVAHVANALITVTAKYIQLKTMKWITLLCF